jgi:uncharacterized RDD family membrane protein YckC
VSTQRLQAGAEQAQSEAIKRLRGSAVEAEAERRAAQTGYAGLVTRTIAFALDAAVINGVAATVGVTVGLGLSILHLPEQADAAIAAVMAALYVVWSLGYFVVFWSTNGQTPGNRVMSIRVIDARRRGHLKPRRALLRFGALCVAAIPLLAGIWMMLWDDQSRCLQDRIARTVVVYEPDD